jgi:hypothetical protein
LAFDAFGIFSGGSSRPDVTGAIKRASTATGANFQYLLATAKMESNLVPDAAASTSSARGLFQFIDQTWLGTVKEAGTQLGYGKYADAIERNDDGSYSVDDDRMRREILKLRDDPVASAAMAGVLTQSNSFKLTGAIGRRPTDSELYMAHFMGVSGASKLINAASDTPRASGADLFPRAAAANRSIFFDKTGNPRSVASVYAVLNDRYAAAANSQATQTAMGTASFVPAPQIAALDTASALALSSSVPGSPAVSISGPIRSAEGVSAIPVATAPSRTSSPEPMFRSLFQAGPRSEPVAPAIRELWGNGASLTSATAQPAVKTPQRLDLFSDRFGTFAG